MGFIFIYFFNNARRHNTYETGELNFELDSL